MSRDIEAGGGTAAGNEVADAERWRQQRGHCRGNADESLLIERITADEDERMPPPEEGGALNSEEIALIRINQGAESP